MNRFLTTRRGMIRSMVGGSILLPGILSELLAQENGQAAADPSDPLAIKPPHFAAKAKRVIFLFSTGGVSHIDTFDPKHNGRDGSTKDGLMGSLWPSGPNPRCGTVISDLFPNVRERMDDICLIRSMKSAHFDHSEAALGMHTGSDLRPPEHGLLDQLWTRNVQPQSAVVYRDCPAFAVRRNAGIRE